MKKIALVFAASFMLAIVVSACNSSAECPAYGQANAEVESVA